MTLSIPKVPYQFFREDQYEWVELYNYLYRKRILLLTQFFQNERSNQLISLLIFLSSENIKSDIFLYVNSPGGLIVCGLSLVDTILFVGANVYTINVGNAFSIASFVVARGKIGKRFVFPRAHFIVRQLNTTHQRGSRGIYLEISEIEHLIVNIRRLYSGFTGQTVKCISNDIDRGGLLNSQQGYIYGISDVVTKNFVEIYSFKVR